MTGRFSAASCRPGLTPLNDYILPQFCSPAIKALCLSMSSPDCNFLRKKVREWQCRQTEVAWAPPLWPREMLAEASRF